MGFTSKAQIDALRTTAFGDITDTYVAIGSPLSYQARIICFTNTTDQNVKFSDDGVTDQVIVPAGGFKLFDVTVNHRPVNQDDFCFPIGTQWYVEYETDAPMSGSVYIEVVYAQPT